mmetsp:Transcript_25202/g.37102  ORF Transcript_25202/g.37102 Transcript_25202/m.37102 type:complete len:320 (+) Transcript_25202:19-978(+)
MGRRQDRDRDNLDDYYHGYREHADEENDNSRHKRCGRNNDHKEDEDVYIVKQKHGYFSILFSISQVGVLAAMMIQCGIAPLRLNPMIGPYPDALSYWGGKNAYLILEEDENWRLITPIFLHAGILHLVGNVAVQMDAGAFFEQEWGSINWLVIYLSSAIGSSMLSCIVMPDYVSVGSSGAVCGLFGAKLAEVFCRACESQKTRQGRIGHEIRKEQLGGVLCSVIVVGLFSFIPFVDWGAHLGGLLTGMAVGMVIFSCSIVTLCWRLFWFLTGAALTVRGFTAAANFMYGGLEPSQDLEDVCGYYAQFFDDYECNCQLEN